MRLNARVSRHNFDAGFSIPNQLAVTEASRELGRMQNHGIPVERDCPSILNESGPCGHTTCSVQVLARALALRVRKDIVDLHCSCDGTDVITDLKIPLEPATPDE